MATDKKEPNSGNTSVDDFLQSLYELTNSADLEVGVTLQVNGKNISGIMISGSEYFKLTDELLSSVWSSDVKEKIDDALEANIEFYSGGSGNSHAQGEQYIHMRNTHIFEGDIMIPSNHDGALWRGKMSSISGFFLGKLEDQEEISEPGTY